MSVAGGGGAGGTDPINWQAGPCVVAAVKRSDRLAALVVL
jgi:hypothetical protein